jgi:hypothetical protein
LENINVLKYSNLNDTTQYDAVLTHLTPLNSFLGVKGDIMQMSYTNVRYCIKLISNANDWNSIAEAFELVFDCSKDDFFKAKIVDYFMARNYIIDTFKLIAKNEKALIDNSGDTVKWEQAGGQRLQPFGDTLPLDGLAQRYGGSPFDWGRKPYSEIYYLIAMTKTLSQIEINYSKMK